jgi:ligand-binding SRPBCC domain-containing protein
VKRVRGWSRPLGSLTTLWLADTSPPAGLTVLNRATPVPASLDETFAFFADASNLERLTPPWLSFRILTPMPVVMAVGLHIDYRVRLYGVPLPWRSRIDVWEPGVRFVDRQVLGPYRWWRHEHRFERAGQHTVVLDEVQYVPRADAVSRQLVRRNLERIFTYRQQMMQEIFGPA